MSDLNRNRTSRGTGKSYQSRAGSSGNRGRSSSRQSNADRILAVQNARNLGSGRGTSSNKRRGRRRRQGPDAAKILLILIGIIILILCVAVACCILLQRLDPSAGFATPVFVLTVLLTSRLTTGYFWGLFSAVLGVIAFAAWYRLAH